MAECNAAVEMREPLGWVGEDDECYGPLGEAGDGCEGAQVGPARADVNGMGVPFADVSHHGRGIAAPDGHSGLCLAVAPQVAASAALRIRDRDRAGDHNEVWCAKAEQDAASFVRKRRHPVGDRRVEGLPGNEDVALVRSH